MLLCVGQDDDKSLAWVADQLRQRTDRRVVIAPVSSLIEGTWNYRQAGGSVIAEVTLADGRCLRTDELSGVVNRLSAIPVELVLDVISGDREYVLAEWRATLAAFLDAPLCRVINRPVPPALSGPDLFPLQWAVAARASGLSPAPYRDEVNPSNRRESRPRRAPHDQLPTACDVFVLGSGIMAGNTLLPNEIRNALFRLRDAVDVDLLHVNLTRLPDGEWQFQSHDPVADLRLGGEPLIDALASSFEL